MKNKMQFGGFNGQEYALIVAESLAHRRYQKWSETTTFDWMEFSDAEKPFICLWSTDPDWIRDMCAVLKDSAAIQQIRIGYNLDVRVEPLPPEKPANGPLAAAWQLMVQELFPLRELFSNLSLK